MFSVEGIQQKLEELFGGLTNDLNGISQNIIMSPEAAFGTDFWESMLRLGTQAIMPFALTLLCFFMAAEFYNIYCKANGGLDLQLVMTTVIKFLVPLLLITHTYDIINLIFGAFNSLILSMNQKIGVEGGAMDFSATIATIMESVKEMSFWDRIGYAFELMPMSWGMWIMNIVISVVIYGRLFEIVLFWVCAPLPFATLIHQEFSDIGKNYVKMFCALIFQGVLMFLCVAIYAALIQSVAIVPDSGGLWQLLGYSAILIFTLSKTGTLSKRMLGTF